MGEQHQNEAAAASPVPSVARGSYSSTEEKNWLLLCIILHYAYQTPGPGAGGTAAKAEAEAANFKQRENNEKLKNWEMETALALQQAPQHLHLRHLRLLHCALYMHTGTCCTLHYVYIRIHTYICVCRL